MKSFTFVYTGKDPIAIHLGHLSLYGERLLPPEFVPLYSGLADLRLVRRQKISVAAGNGMLVQLLRSRPDVFREN